MSHFVTQIANSLRWKMKMFHVHLYKTFQTDGNARKLQGSNIGDIKSQDTPSPSLHHCE